jgi:serine/threonine-protein kinase
MGSLYKARHPTLGRTVLLKKLALRGGSQMVERFRREARLMMDLQSESIVQVYDHFKEGPNYVIVEEYVEGLSLDALIRRERYLSNEAATLILYEICRALKYAHDRQVIHRDIKPANILISRDGHVKLTDFGIATSQEDAEDGLTRDGMILGTPAYLPPEQIDDPRSVDRRADIYAVGVVLYEMLTGRTPFPSSLSADTIAQIHRGRYTPAHRINPRSSPFLRRIARRCMKVKPGRRFQDLDDLIRILERRIRRTETSVVREALAALLKGGTIDHLFRSEVSWQARVAVASLGALILIAGGLWAWQQGYAYELFAADRYGALTISAVVESASQDSLPVGPVLYREEPGLTRLDGVDFGLHEVVSRRTADQRVFVSRRIYLEPGRYRLEVELDGELYWRAFDLASRAEQRTSFATVDGLTVGIRRAAAPRLPLSVRYDARDAATGANLGAAAHLLVNSSGRWVEVGDPSLDLTTGATWHFRIGADGYRPEDFSVSVMPSQVVLDLEADLERNPP